MKKILSDYLDYDEDILDTNPHQGEMRKRFLKEKDEIKKNDAMWKCQKFYNFVFQNIFEIIIINCILIYFRHKGHFRPYHSGFITGFKLKN